MSQLDNAQSRAVHTVSGPVLIRAGAGAGKTRVLVERAVNIVDAGVDPERVLLATFTNKAAGEMGERLIGMMGERAEQMFIGTLHSFAWRCVIQHLEMYDHLDVIDRRSGLRIASRNQLYRMQSEAMSALGSVIKKTLDKTFVSVDDLYRALGLVRAEGIRASQIDVDIVDEVLARHSVNDVKQEGIRSALPRYAQAFDAAATDLNVIDFDDILVLAKVALENDADTLGALQEQFHYFQGDEFQDTNEVQLGIFDLLARKTRNICVCGDDRQAIYSFRGADPFIMEKFLELYPDTTIVELRNNYRSSQTVVSTANACAAAMPSAFAGEHHGMIARQRRLRADRPQCRIFNDDKAEATGIIEWLQGKKLSETVVLFRSRKIKEALENALLEAQIPYEVASEKSFFEYPEVQMAQMLATAWATFDGFAWRKSLGSLPLGMSEDSIAFHWEEGGFTALEKAVNKKRGKTSDDLKAFVGEARALYEGLQQAMVDPDGDIGAQLNQRGAVARKLNAAWHRWLKNRFEGKWRAMLVRQFKKRIGEEPDGENLVVLEQELGQRVEVATRRIQLLNRVIDRLWMRRKRMDSVMDDLERYEPGGNEDPPEDERDVPEVLRLMTVHAAKGLEAANVVYIGGADVAKSEDVIEHEERRIFYVGITRAKDHLLITGALHRENLDKSARDRSVSPFIDEVDDTVDRVLGSEQGEEHFRENLNRLRDLLPKRA